MCCVGVFRDGFRTHVWRIPTDIGRKNNLDYKLCTVVRGTKQNSKHDLIGRHETTHLDLVCRVAQSFGCKSPVELDRT